MTSDDITAEYPIVRRTVYSWQAKGLIHVWKFGRTNIYDRRELEALIVAGQRVA